MPHELAGALQQPRRIRQRCPSKKSHVHVRSEYIDVPERCIPQTRNRTPIMQQFPDFVAAFPHHLKPLARYLSQFPCMLAHPRIDRGIPLHAAVKSKQFRSHRRSISQVSSAGQSLSMLDGTLPLLIASRRQYAARADDNLA